MRFFLRFAVAWLLLLAAAGGGSADEPVSFRRQIAPILLEHCVACHGPNKSEGSLRLDSYQHLRSEGDSGAPAFEPEDPDGSEAFLRITSEDEADRMPLDADPLPAEQIALIRRWIEQGARCDAADPQAPLATIVPPPVYPPPPERYPTALPVTALAFTPDGKQLVASGYHELTVWDVATGQLARRIGNMGQRTLALAFSPDGKTLAAAGGQPARRGEVRLFDPASGRLTGVLAPTGDVYLDVAFSPSGQRLAAVGADRLVHLLELAADSEQILQTGQADWLTAVAWSPDGGRLAVASRDKTVKIVDAQRGEVLAGYSGHTGAVLGVAFHPDGQHAYSGAEDRRIHFWSVAGGKKVADVATCRGEVYKLVAAGGFLFAPSADRTVRQFDLASRKLLRTYSGHADAVLSVAYHAATRRLASGSFDGQVRLWDAESGKLIGSLVAAPGYKR